MTKNLWHEAASLAARAHRYHLRKDDATPYLAHPSRVALTIAVVFGEQDPAILAAAFLHDVIEDTGVDYDDIIEEFGPEVADYVAAMSKDARMIEPEREAAYDRQLASGPWQARLIKLADVYDNLADAPPAQRPKLREKAVRALEFTANDPQCNGARAALEALMKSLD